MQEKSAIDLIYEMHEMLQNIEARVALMEKNIRLLNDKNSGALLGAMREPAEQPKSKNEGYTTPAASVKPSVGLPSPNPPGKTVIKPTQSQPTEAGPENAPPPRIPNTRVFGSFKDGRNKPIPDIEVAILNANNNIVKQTRTNRGGEWLCFLPPGRYSAEFMKEGLAPQFKVFEVVEGQVETEVL